MLIVSSDEYWKKKVASVIEINETEGTEKMLVGLN